MNTYRPEYYLAGRNRLRHIRDAFSKQGFHAENYCLECKGKKPLDWTKNGTSNNRHNNNVVERTGNE